MASCCSNCAKRFVKKPDNKGFYRYSLESSLPKSSEIARETLSKLTGVQFTPVSNKSRGQFLCPVCWCRLKDTVSYQRSLNEFWERTKPATYIGHKRGSESSTKHEVFPKRPRYTSTPLAVSNIFFSRVVQQFSPRWIQHYETLLKLLRQIGLF